MLLDGFAALFLESGAPYYDITPLMALNGSDALALMESVTPDLIVTDVGMPQMDGYELLQAVRARPEWVHIPFVFLTGHSSDSAVRRGRTSGAELYLTKPVDPDELVAVVLAQLDLARSRLQQRAQSADTVRKEILHTLQHEFRTPLGYVTAYYEILADGFLTGDPPEAMSEYLHGIQMGAARLRKLVQELILVIDLFSGNAARAFQETAAPLDDVMVPLRRAYAAVADDARQHDVALHLDLPPHLPPVYGVRRLLFEVFVRLLDNAVKFTAMKRDHAEGGGAVDVSADVAEGVVRCTIRDNGIGIPGSAIANLCDLFYQHDRPNLEQQGTGAGLTIAHGFVTLHGGSIEVESKPGVGSTFTVILPIHDTEPAAASPEPAAAPNRRVVTVLLVDDSPLLLDGIADLFDLLGAHSAFEYVVVKADSGFKALRLLDKHAVDLILCDVMMPGMDGYAFLEQVHANPKWVTIPVIFLTAQATESEISRGLRMGVDDYLVKPYNPGELFDVVEARLKRQFAVQDVMQAGFQALRERILSSLTTHLIDPLDTVADHSQALLDGVSAAETPEDLKQSLMAIEVGSNQLATMIADFTLLAELRAGAVNEAGAIRPEPIRYLEELVESACQAALNSADSRPPHLHLTVTRPGTYAVLGNRKLLGDLFRRLAHLHTVWPIDVGNAGATVSDLHVEMTHADDNVAVRYTYRPKQDTAQLVADMRALIENKDRRAIANPTLNSLLLISSELVALHHGTLRVNVGPEQTVFITVLLPTDSAETTTERADP